MQPNNPRTVVQHIFDFIVVGSGLAGLYAAFCAARHGRVALLSKSSLTSSSSYWAQGGIAAAIDPEDSAYLHFDDTITAGRGLCRRAAVELLVGEGAARVRELISMGMQFDADAFGLHLGLEGGHSRRRILHAQGNATGAAVVNFLLDRVKEDPQITIFDNTTVAELVVVDDRCVGLMAFQRDDLEPTLFTARATILATGGAAGNFLRTTNSPTSPDDGIALAYRSGAEVCDMEFIQFHPTALYTESGSTFLISEALRGEGGHLFDKNNRRFMLDYDPLAELAPRDVVASAIFKVMHESKTDHVYLSMKHLDAKYIRERFRNVYDACLVHKIDITKDLIPVAPAAHYTIGGIVTGRMAGTSIWGLFACGEVACTGVHGANRLASNSLLECLVFGRRAVDGALTVTEDTPRKAAILSELPIRDTNPLEPDLEKELRKHIATFMTEKVGILRTGAELQSALIELYEIRERYHKELASWAGRPLRAMQRVCTLIARGALTREESRGSHQRVDHPEEVARFEGHITQHRGKEPRIEQWT